ncbi:hypothetical protein [Sulfurospirillum sp.]|uniref:hypothetical protein n=1 Tax=Sulfurospirillum sp. TaxID=2053622 RepID=UPI002FDEF7F0
MKSMFVYVVIVSILFGVSSVQAQTFDLSHTDQVKPNNVIVKSADFEGRKSLQVYLSEEKQAQILKGLGGNHATFALIPVTFQNGIIEVDIAGEVNGKGDQDARGFTGIAFRINNDVSKFEAIYLRMTNGRNAEPIPPSPRIDRAIQYISYPDWSFDRFRNEFPEQYEKGANIAPKKWIHLKIEVKGSVAKAYLNNELEPAITVSDLKMGAEAKGSVGLWVDDGSNGYFSNLQITSY